MPKTLYNVGIILKRILKWKMTKEDILWPVRELISDHTWIGKNAPWVEDFISTNEYADGTRVDEIWRRNITWAAGEISTEATWRLQRTKLVEYCVNASSWIALRNAILPNFAEEVWLWEDMVSNFDQFTNNEKTKYGGILETEAVYNMLNYSVLLTAGMACYGIPSEYDNNIRFYQKLKQYSIEKRIPLLRGLRDGIHTEDKTPEQIVLLFRLHVSSYWSVEEEFFKQLARDIAEMKSIDRYADEWEVIATKYNHALAEWGESVESK